MKRQWKEDLFFIALKLVLAGIVLAVILLWLFGVVRCADNAMEPSCKDGDIVLYNRMEKEYQENDLVVLSVEGKIQVRRIVAVPGDTVKITEEGVFFNGYRQQEMDSIAITQPYEDGIRYPVTLGDGEYFVLADKRTNTEDSRMYGVVYENEIKGSVITLLRRRGF